MSKPHTLTGEFRTHARFHSAFLEHDRDVIVYLPPGYHDDEQRRFPTLYLHDGQNLFDAASSFGEEWCVDETAQFLISLGIVEPVIIVGIYNAGNARLDEYTPARDRKHRRGGGADAYGRMLVEELQPMIDREYRTIPDADHTGLGGSSLGGLLTMHLGLAHPDVFRRLAVLSPSVWWASRTIVRSVETLTAKPPLKIWLSVGTAEGRNVVPDARRLRDALIDKGWLLGADLSYFEMEGAGHNEGAWATLVDPMLRFLFPVQK